MNDLHDLTLTRPEGDNAGGAAAPAVPAGNLFTVECWEVEHGDILFGLHHRIGSILTDGQWWYYGDDHGMIIAKRSVGSRVQVVRGGSDDCDPHGIDRPPRRLEVVR